MGVSSDGLLVYGIDLGEEMPDFLVDHEDLDDLLLTEGKQPKYGEEGHDFKSQRTYLENQPVEMTFYCSYDCPMHILSVRGTEKSVNRGYVEEITSLEVDPDKRQKFIEWCLAHGIANPEPKWLLASMYG